MSPTVPVTPVSPVQVAVADYLAAVGHDLAGLPEGERQDILEEVAEHLADVAAELGPEADARALEARLGSARTYASELRSAAGYDEPPRSPRVRRATESVRGFGASARDAMEAMRGGPETVAFLRRLRPAWWVLRAWVVGQWLAIGVSNRSAHVIPQFRSNGFIGLIVFVLLAIWSVRVGLRSERLGRAAPWRRTVVAANVFAVIVTLPVLAAFQSHDFSGPASFSADPSPSDGLTVVDGNGNLSAPGNLFAFGPDGKPIDQFRLYDQDGHPVVLPAADTGDCWAGTTAAAASPSNVYPLPQLTPQLDANGNPTGTCTASSGTPAFVVPPLAGFTPTPTPSVSPSASVPTSPAPSHASPSHASPSQASPSSKATKH